jgi:hypothetical protein
MTPNRRHTPAGGDPHNAAPAGSATVVAGRNPVVSALADDREQVIGTEVAAIEVHASRQV